MKKLLFALLAVCLVATSTFAAVLCYQVEVDQDTKMYIGSDTTNYVVIPSGTNRTFIRGSATQAVFAQASSAKTSAPNLRIGFQLSKYLSRDSEGQKMQGCTVDAIGNYYLTKSSAIPLN